MSEPLLTAIIFTYNHKKHIARCIESIVNQNTSYSYIIKIYDDCSYDGTTDICREYASKYPDKIKLTVQPKNTFLMPYKDMQSYKAIQEIDTKYFCIIDGDDCWCDENKIQIALDCLESHPEYIGFAHDTKMVDLFAKREYSYVHDCKNWNDFENPVIKKAEPYFFTSSRIFRNCGFKNKHMIPVDYLIYFYHAVRGPIYYYDKIMAHYYRSQYNTFGNVESKEIRTLETTFGYKIAEFFDFKEDELAMDCQKYYNPKSCESLKKYKNVFGVKWGWRIWYLVNFVPMYGFESFDLNWVCSRKLIKKRADNRKEVEKKRIKKVLKSINELVKINKQQYFLIKIIDFVTKFDIVRNSKICDLQASKERKLARIKNRKEYIKALCKSINYSHKVIKDRV